MKYVGGVVSTEIGQSKMIEFIQKQYKENGVGRLAVIEKSSNPYRMERTKISDK